MELYKISFPLHSPGKSYIGISSKGASARFKEHCASKKSYPIVQAIRKYGANNAVLEVLGRFDCFDALYAAEQAAIASHGSKSPNGYNLTDGGKGTFGLAASEERKRKISDANKGRKMPIEQRKKISEHNKTRDLSVQVAAMAAANRGVKRSKEFGEKVRQRNIGRKVTDETREKMSASASKRRASEETKRRMSESIKKSRGDKSFWFISPAGEKCEVRNMKEFCRSNALTTVHMYNIASGKAIAHKGWRGVL